MTKTYKTKMLYTSVKLYEDNLRQLKAAGEKAVSERALHEKSGKILAAA